MLVENLAAMVAGWRRRLRLLDGGGVDISGGRGDVWRSDKNYETVPRTVGVLCVLLVPENADVVDKQVDGYSITRSPLKQATRALL